MKTFKIKLSLQETHRRSLLGSRILTRDWLLAISSHHIFVVASPYQIPRFGG